MLILELEDFDKETRRKESIKFNDTIIMTMKLSDVIYVDLNNLPANLLDHFAISMNVLKVELQDSGLLSPHSIATPYFHKTFKMVFIYKDTLNQEYDFNTYSRFFALMLGKVSGLKHDKRQNINL